MTPFKEPGEAPNAVETLFSLVQGLPKVEAVKRRPFQVMGEQGIKGGIRRQKQHGALSHSLRCDGRAAALPR